MKRLRTVTVFLIGILLLVSMGSVYALSNQFVLSITNLSYAPIEYSSLGGIDPPSTGSFTFSHKKGNVIAAAVFSAGLHSAGNYLDRKAANGSNTEFLQYQIYQNNTSSIPWSDTINANGTYSDYVYVSNLLTSNNLSTYTIPFHIAIPSGQNVSSGTYTDTIQLQLFADFEEVAGVSFVSSYDTWPGSATPLTLSITVSGYTEILVSPKVAASFLPMQNGVGTVSNLSVATITEISTDTSYSVTLTSLNNGRLVGAATGDQLIYTATYNGAGVTLSSVPQTISNQLPPTTLSGITKDFAISYTIIDSLLPEDVYTDNLVFTIIGN